MEDLTDRHRQLVSPLGRGDQLPSGGPNSHLDRRPQRPLLVSAPQQCDQLLTASIGDQPDQPPQQVIHDKHVRILPPLAAHGKARVQENKR
jgi:hypothetical protein